MPGVCCVPKCFNTGGHRIPTDPILREKWRVAIRRVDDKNKLWKFTDYDVVCRAHFLPTDYTSPGLLNERRRLIKGTVPTVFTFKKPPTALMKDRAQRLEKRRANIQIAPPNHEVTKEAHKPDDASNPTEIPIVMDSEIAVTQEFLITDMGVATEVPIGGETASTPCYLCGCTCKTIAAPKENLLLSPVDLSVTEPHASQRLSSTTEPQTSKSPSASYVYDIYKLKDDSRAILYYTGFSSFDHFMYLYWLLGPAKTQLNYQCSSIKHENQLFMTLMKLRQAKDNIELSMMFGVCSTTVGKIVKTWINFLYYQLKEIEIWLPKEDVERTMPHNFGKQFPHTRVVLDATEVPIAKPSDLDLQSATFSSYKNKNTAKTMIGISPSGMVTYISDAYGGSTTDRQIVERSPLCSSDMLQAGDSIMSDRGIMVQDLFASKDVTVNTPHMLNGKSQLSSEDVVYDRRIASKRIHVERVIGLAKTYKILKREVPSTMRHLIGRIVYICFSLVNLRAPIVGEMA